MTQTVLDEQIGRLVLAAALGLFLGLEREWSDKTAGVRTLSLISLLGAVFVVLGNELLLVVGGLFVIVQGALLSSRGLIDEGAGLSLTTGASMLVAYGVGALVGSGLLLEGVTVAVVSSLLLVLKRELHNVAHGLSREEVRSAVEFAILAFVIYPLLPVEPSTLTVLDFELSVETRIVWLMVVTVAGIGIVNYAVVTTYGGRGVAVTGFFGGLASSTAVVGTMLDHVKQRPEAASYAVAAVLLANAAMAARNLAIALAFTVETGLLTQVVVPLGTVVVGSVVVAYIAADWGESVELELETPFRLRYALAFGAVFLVIVVTGGVARGEFGTIGLFVTAAIAGLVSSAGATTSAVLLYRNGTVTAEVATVAILLATATSIGVKVGLTTAAPERDFAVRVAGYSIALLALAAVTTYLVL